MRLASATRALLGVGPTGKKATNKSFPRERHKALRLLVLVCIIATVLTSAGAFAQGWGAPGVQRRGASVASSVTATPLDGGFTGLVALTVTGLPTDGSGSFGLTPLDVTPASSSTNLTVTTSPTTAPGNYTLTITGASGSLTHTSTVILYVKRK